MGILRGGVLAAIGVLLVMLTIQGTLASPFQYDPEPGGTGYVDISTTTSTLVNGSEITPPSSDDSQGDDTLPDAAADVPPGAYEPGDREVFDINGTIINATCRKVGRHCYLFIEEGSFLNAPHFNLDSLQTTFDDVIYPRNTEIFGSELDVDGDGRIFVVLLSSLDGALGVFDLQSLAHNQKDMILISSGTLVYDDIYATIAHEFQHLIHFNHDFDEGAMIDEGCAVYAELIYANFSTEDLYAIEKARQYPNVSLQWAWEDYQAGNNMGAHYGVSGLWILYLSEKYGDLSGNPDHAHFIRDLVEEDKNGFASVDAVLAMHGYGNRSEDIFKTWVIANYLDDTGENPLYGYESIDFDTPMRREASVEQGDLALTNGTYSFPAVSLPAWSAAYYTIGSDAPENLSFTCDGECWHHRIDEGNRSVTVVVSPLNVSGDAILTVHADGVRKAMREKHPRSA